MPGRLPELQPPHVRRRAGRWGASVRTWVHRRRPEPMGEDVAALLDEAEDIVNAAAPDILAEFEKPKSRFGKRKKRKKK